MNITLTQQDADFILKYIRICLQNVSESRSEMREEYKSLTNQFTKNLKDNNEAKKLMSFASEITSVIDDATQKTESDLEKCVLLLTVGSEATE